MKRREFLRTAGCGAMGATTLINTLANLKMMNGLLNSNSYDANNFNDYKALVCISFNGGLDSYNTLIPRGTTTGGDNGFNEYKTLRSDLAIANVNDVWALNNPALVAHRGISSAYNSFGVHTAMPEVQTLFNQGKLAFMANIGTLVEPITNYQQYNSGLKKIPLGLYSHSDQWQQWQTSLPQSRESLGFGGRVADLLYSSNSNQQVSMNISLAGKNSFQRGKEISEYAVGQDVSSNNVGFVGLPSWYSNSGLLTHLRDEAIRDMSTDYYTNLMKKTYATTTKSVMSSFEVFKDALTKVPTITTSFPDSEISRDLLAVAKIMSVRTFMGVKRQIFFVDFGGWDMHDNLVTGLNNRLPMVSRALKAFYDVTVELGIADKVTTFTISDFARTATSNGQGSDHGWGGNSMVMGGAVNGNKIFGAFPKMDATLPTTSNNTNTQLRSISNRGNFIPAVGTDELYAELALWYGVSPSDLCYALPNLGNFYTYSTNNYPLGLMNFSGTSISTNDRPQGCLTF
ncbi:MAG: DUF1501 domain-containing protein [Leadbetterella sp.]